MSLPTKASSSSGKQSATREVSMRLGGRLSQGTLDRCMSFELDERSKKRFTEINPSLLSLLTGVNTTSFSVYAMLDDDIVTEFVKKNTQAAGIYIANLQEAVAKNKDRLMVKILKSDKADFLNLIRGLREAKVKSFIAKNPDIAPRIMQVFSNLSSVDEMILAGGLSAEVVEAAKAAAPPVSCFTLTLLTFGIRRL